MPLALRVAAGGGNIKWGHSKVAGVTEVADVSVLLTAYVAIRVSGDRV